jgi:hypothetical protein
LVGLIFDDRVFEKIKPLISFISWGTFGATLGGIAGFVVGFLVAPEECYIVCAYIFPNLISLSIGAAVGSILGNLLATTDYSDDKLLALLFISIPAGAILGIGLSILAIVGLFILSQAF